MVDDEALIRPVHILEGGDGDRPGTVPGGGGKRHGRGEGEGIVGQAEKRRHRHDPGRGGAQCHRVGGPAAFGNVEGERGNLHAGPAQRDGHSKPAPGTGDVVGPLGHADQGGRANREGRRRGRAKGAADTLPRRNAGHARDAAAGRPGDGDGQRGGLRNGHPCPGALPLQAHAQGERAAVVAVQGQLGELTHPVEQPVGQGGETIAGQIQRRQRRACPGEDVRGQGGETIAGQIQSQQRIQAEKVLALEHRDARAGEVQRDNPSQVGAGDGRAVAAGRRLEGATHALGAGADRARDLDGEGKAGGATERVPVGDDPVVGDGGGAARGGAGEGAGVEVDGQAIGQAPVERVDDAATAANGRRQGEGGNGNADAVDLRGDGGPAEKGHGAEPVGNRDDDAGERGEGTVAADAVADGDDVGDGVLVLGGTDGDGLNTVPRARGKDQRRGEPKHIVGGDRRGDGDNAGGNGAQPDGIGGVAAFGNGEAVGGDDPARVGRHGGQLEPRPGVVVIVGRLGEADEGGVAELDGQGDKVAQAERPAGAPARLNGGGAGGDTGDGPGQGDGTGGRGPDARLEPTAAPQLGLDEQTEGTARVAVEADAVHQVQAVKQSGGQGLKLVVVKRQGGQGTGAGEEVGGQVGQSVAAQVEAGQGGLGVEEVTGEGLDPVVVQLQAPQGSQRGEEVFGQGDEAIVAQHQGGQGTQILKDAGRQGGDPGVGQ